MSAIRSVRTKPWRFFAMSVAGILVIAVLLYLFFGARTKEAEAQIAVLYSSTCLGGWKNADHAVGVPEVAGNSEATYTDENSATLKDSMTQLFCGGFKGDIPDAVDRTKISLRFSWQMESHEAFQKERIDSQGSDYKTEVITVSASSTDSATSTESGDGQTPQSDSGFVPPEAVPDVPEESPAEEVAPVVEEAPVPEAVSWWQWLVPFAYAQEESEEVVTETVPTTPEEVITPAPEVELEKVSSSTDETSIQLATSTQDIIVSSTTATSGVSYSYVSPVFDQNKDKDNALFEVLFTIDNVQWHSLGYVSRINNDIAFELPVDMFPTVEDFNKLQISLESVERIDDTPKIYLDSMWVEVSYVGVGEDPLTPPGSLGGDIIMNTYQVDENELVTVFRGVSLETISNILLLTASSSTSTTATASTSEGALASTTSGVTETMASSTASTTVVIYDAPITLETKNILRETPGVLVELWLHNKIEDTWMRVADNSAVGTLPRAVLIDKKVFWFGPNNSALWVFDPVSQGYSSQSISPQQRVSIDYLDSASEPSTVWFNPQTEQLEEVVDDK